ncbi:MAG TPA: hypothetical protein VFU43_09505 [Streptosporangiaceae bacterium]|nr:hypothetical protein [Streptosporangiaceae bacterium]
MDLSARPARYAAGRPRPLIVEAPGATRVRLAVEAELGRRGWRAAAAPAETGLLLVCGEPGPDLAAAIETVWQSMPGPRARVRLPVAAAAAEVAEALDRARAELGDVAAARADALTRSAAELHHVDAPAGLAMAERGPDRDGLRLDVLRVPLGPVLPHWPAGLRIMVTLQGDVVQAAAAEAMDGGGGGSFWDEPWLSAQAGGDVTRGLAARRRAGAHLDTIGRLLAVAGWPAAAARARRLRDDALNGPPGSRLISAYAAFARRTGRSRPLRWMLRDVGVIDAAAVERHGLTGPPARHQGDAAARLRGLLAETAAALERADDATPLDAATEGPRGPVERSPSAALLAALPELLTGTELSVARLIVAGLDPDLGGLAGAGAGAATMRAAGA